MIQAVCFDMDGTLIDTEVLWTEAIQSHLHNHQITLPKADVERLVYGRSWSDIYAEIIQQYPDIEESQQEMSSGIQTHYFRLREARDIRIMPSIELLRQLADSLPVCIVSGSEAHMVEHGIEIMGIAECLAFFLSGDRYSPGKPSPVCYQMAAERLGMPPEQCLVFEDSKAGVLSAKAAGMWCVALVQPGRPQQDVSQADQIVETLADFDLDEFTQKIAAA